MSVIASAVRTYIQHDVQLVVKTIKTLTDNAECMHMCIISRRAHNSLRDALATLEFSTVRLVASAADYLSYSSASPRFPASVVWFPRLESTHDATAAAHRQVARGAIAAGRSTARPHGTAAGYLAVRPPPSQ
jgi:hypothetical protein